MNLKTVFRSLLKPTPHLLQLFLAAACLPSFSVTCNSILEKPSSPLAGNEGWEYVTPFVTNIPRRIVKGQQPVLHSPTTLMGHEASRPCTKPKARSTPHPTAAEQAPFHGPCPRPKKKRGVSPLGTTPDDSHRHRSALDPEPPFPAAAMPPSYPTPPARRHLRPVLSVHSSSRPTARPIGRSPAAPQARGSRTPV